MGWRTESVSRLQKIANDRLGATVPVRWVMVVACFALLGTGSPPRAPAKTYVANGWTLDVRLVPEKKTILLGEPIYLDFIVDNGSSQNLSLLVGGDYRNNLGRPNRFSVEATRADGEPVPVPDAGQTRGGMIVPKKLPANGRYIRKLFLPNWARITQPGEYTVVCRRTLKLGEHGIVVSDLLEKSIDVDVVVEASIRVVPYDNEKMGLIVARLGDQMRSESEDIARRAARALGHVHDVRSIPHWVAVLDSKNDSLMFSAIRALAKYNDDRAFRGLQRAMKLTVRDVGPATKEWLAANGARRFRHAAAYAIAQSPHPAARDFLLLLWADEQVPIRITVLHALGRMNSPESLWPAPKNLIQLL